MTLKSMIAALVGYVGARFLGAGLGLLTQLVLTRSLAPGDVTIVFMAMSAAAFLSLLMNGGQAQLASTHLPRLLEINRPSILAAFHATVLRDMIVVFAGLGLVMIAVWWFRLFDDGAVLAVFAGLLAAPFSGLARYNSMVANSMRWFPLSYVPDFLARPGLFLCAIAVFYFLGMNNNVIAVLVAFVAFVWLVGLGQAVLMEGQGLRLSHARQYSARYGRAVRPRSMALLIVGVVSFAIADVSMLLAGFLMTPEDAAVAGVAVRLAAIAGFILQAAQLFVLPDFTQAMARRDTAVANTLLWRMNALTVLMALAALIAALVLGEFALSLFGEAYVAGAGLLMLFLVAQTIRALGGMNQNLLAIEGHQIRTAWSCLLALAIFVLGALVFIPRFGLEGLGLAAIASELAWMLALASQANNLCGRRADLLWLARRA